jgi:hypothetical protein
MVYHRRHNRVQLDSTFRRKLFNCALEREGGEAQVGRALGY